MSVDNNEHNDGTGDNNEPNGINNCINGSNAGGNDDNADDNTDGIKPTSDAADSVSNGAIFDVNDEPRVKPSIITPWTVWGYHVYEYDQKQSRFGSDDRLPVSMLQASIQPTFKDAINVIRENGDLLSLLELHKFLQWMQESTRNHVYTYLIQAMGGGNIIDIIDDDTVAIYPNNAGSDDSVDAITSADILDGDAIDNAITEALVEVRMELTRWEREQVTQYLREALKTVRWYARRIKLVNLHLKRRASVPNVSSDFWEWVQREQDDAELEGDDYRASMARCLLLEGNALGDEVNAHPDRLTIDGDIYIQPPEPLW